MSEKTSDVFGPRQMEYIDSVDGRAHMSAVEIIGKLEAKIRLLKMELHPPCTCQRCDPDGIDAALHEHTKKETP